MIVNTSFISVAEHLPEMACIKYYCYLQATFTTGNMLMLSNASSTAQFYGKGALSA